MRKLLFLLSFLAVSIALAQPKSGFTATPVQGCNPLKVDFTNTSTNAVSYLWKFGNGNESTLPNPSAVYNQDGKYTVILIATDASGNKDTAVFKDLITVFKNPKADFTSNKQEICSGDEVKFTNTSTEGDGPINKVNWDFGEGGAAATSNPAYTYTLAGTFDVTLIIKDVNGCESTLKKKQYMKVHELPKVSFTADNQTKCKPVLDVNFTSECSGYGILKYLWNFGNGNTSTDENPIQSYDKEGAYSVSLMVTDGRGCVRKFSRNDYILIQPPSAGFSVQKRVICQGDKVQFTNLSLPLGSGSFEWDFNNGTTSTEREPLITFDNPGVYKVKLKMSWDGCEDTEEKPAYITVNPAPKGVIIPGDSFFCRGIGNVPFSLSGTNIAKTEWYLDGEKDTTIQSNASYLFNTDKSGKFEVFVTATSDNGCKTTLKPKTIEVDGPEPAFEIEDAQGCFPRLVKLRYTGKGNAPIQNYWWSYPDTLERDVQNTSFTLNKFGTFPVSLTVKDSRGCFETVAKKVEAGIKIIVDFNTPVKEICRNQTFFIYNKSSHRSPDTVIFQYTWDTDDSMVFENRDSTGFKLLGKPNEIARLSIIANSKGCISELPEEKEMEVMLRGPEVKGISDAICTKDTLKASNKSTHYTESWWKVISYDSGTYLASEKDIALKLSTAKDLWLFAQNDSWGCIDSTQLLIKVDKQQVDFDFFFDCKKSEISTKNKYQGLKDTQYLWVLHNTTTDSIYKLYKKDLKQIVKTPGLYKLTLNVLNTGFICNLPKTITFRIYEKLNAKPEVRIDRTNCYPIKMELNDPLFDKWRTANWYVGNSLTVKDSAAKLEFIHSDNDKELQTILLRTDSNNCLWADTFNFTIGGFQAYGYYAKNDISCNRTVFDCIGQVFNGQNGVTYTYSWKFGDFKTSTKWRDTFHIHDWMNFPISLTVKDNTGCESTDVMKVEARISKPKANFGISNNVVKCPPLLVKFSDLSQPGNSPIVSRYWDFGDGTYSDKVNPEKIYLIPGKYTVKLVVFNKSGCGDTIVLPDVVVVDGPTGNYSFDKKSGCSPLYVNLSTTTGGKIFKYEFDMGDGAVLDKNGKYHTFERPGMYIPRLILTDSIGCRYSPPAKDTIHVFANPVAYFDSAMICDNAEFELTHSSYFTDDGKAGLEWWHKNKIIAKTDTCKWNPNESGKQAVMLVVSTTKGCTDTMVRNFRTMSITPALSSLKSAYCLGENIQLFDNSVADTTIVIRRMLYNGNAVTYSNPLILPANMRGMIPVELQIEDILGCKDTLKLASLVKIGDTLPPAAVPIIRTTVLDNYSNETRFFSSLQADFKNYELQSWLMGSWQKTAESSNRYDTSLLVNGLNTLQNSYCHRVIQTNFCDKKTDTSIIKEHCTIEIKAKGDTNSIVVNWLPYRGWNAVKKYRIHRKIAGEPNFKVLDSVSGNTYTYTDRTNICKITYDYLIEGVDVNDSTVFSMSDTARATPLNFYRLPAPEIWRSTVESDAFAQTEWQMLSNPRYPLKKYSVYRKDENGWELYRDNYAVQNGMLIFQDMNTKVHQRNYTYQINATDVCDNVSPLSNPGRTIHLAATLHENKKDANLSWTPYIHWNEGVENYIVERSIEGAAFQEIARVSSTDSTFTDTNLPLYCAKDFVYRITGIRNQPEQTDSSYNVVSVSNTADFVPPMHIYIPNAFTPDDNRLNDGFAPKGVFIYKYRLTVFNRWGEKLYESDACQNFWDGLYQGEKAADGVYAYKVEAWDLEMKMYQFVGTVHVLR